MTLGTHYILPISPLPNADPQWIESYKRHISMFNHSVQHDASPPLAFSLLQPEHLAIQPFQSVNLSMHIRGTMYMTSQHGLHSTSFLLCPCDSIHQT